MEHSADIPEDGHPRVIRSTVPLFPAASITSPTANWFSTRMKNPR